METGPSVTLSEIFTNTQCIKNLNVSFWQKVCRREKWSQSGKAPSGGEAEIENDKYATCVIFNFSSATRWHF